MYSLRNHLKRLNNSISHTTYGSGNVFDKQTNNWFMVKSCLNKGSEQNGKTLTFIVISFASSVCGRCGLRFSGSANGYHSCRRSSFRPANGHCGSRNATLLMSKRKRQEHWSEAVVWQRDVTWRSVDCTTEQRLTMHTHTHTQVHQLSVRALNKHSSRKSLRVAEMADGLLRRRRWRNGGHLGPDVRGDYQLLCRRTKAAAMATTKRRRRRRKQQRFALLPIKNTDSYRLKLFYRTGECYLSSLARNAQ